VDQEINSSIRSTCLSFRYVLAGVQTCEPRGKRRPWIGRLDVESLGIEIGARVVRHYAAAPAQLLAGRLGRGLLRV